jgi:hypothetical protein
MLILSNGEEVTGERERWDFKHAYLYLYPMALRSFKNLDLPIKHAWGS